MRQLLGSPIARPCAGHFLWPLVKITSFPSIFMVVYTPMKECSINGCEGELLARGLCRKHYLRWYKHGDPFFTKERKHPIGENAYSYKHGKWDHYLYKTWRNMISRCENKNDHAYKNYGARGIYVCEEWHDINSFISDMGDRPEGASLDRINNDGPYSPQNCRWATNAQQSRNRRFAKLDMETAQKIRSEPRRSRNGRGPGMTKKQIAEKYGVSVATIKKVLSMAYWDPSSS